MSEAISGNLSNVVNVSGNIAQVQTVDGTLTVGGDMLPVYNGPVNIVPGSDAVLLNTKGTTVLENITITAVPAGYGKIVWNGSILTVS